MKVRAVLTVSCEFPIDREHYGPGATPESIAETVKESILNDPYLFVDHSGAVLECEVETEVE